MMDSIKKAFSLYGKAVTLFLIIAGVNIIANIINTLIIPPPASGAMTLGVSLAIIAFTVVLFIVALYVQGGTLSCVKELVKTGTPKLAGFPENAKKYLLKLLGLTLIIIAVAVALVFLSGLIIKALPVVVKIAAGIVIGAIFVPFAVMPAYALVGSNLGVIAALKKGVLLSAKRFLTILVMLLIIALIGALVLVISALAIGLLSFAVKPAANYITGVIIGVVNAALTILVNIAFMDFYLKNEAQ